MIFLHALAALLSGFRLTELFLADRITAPVRKYFPKSYLLSCPRCMSVWCAAIATGMFLIYPYANWPFAFAYLYLWHMDFAFDRRIRREGRQFVVRMENNKQGQIVKSELSPQELQAVFQTIFPPKQEQKTNGGLQHPSVAEQGQVL